MNQHAPRSDVLNQDALQALLHWTVAEQATDTLLCSNRRVHISCHGEYMPVPGRCIATWELARLLDAIHMRSSSTRLTSGEDLDFTYEFRLDRVRRLRFRVNAVSTSGAGEGERGIAMTLRHIPNQVPTLEHIELSTPLLGHIETSEQGLILVTGATGSGKSTLLAACLAHTLRNPPGRYIVSYEAPIEFDLSGVPDTVGIIAQSEIPRDLPSFSDGIRNALRRAPDIILIGEARDRETIAGVVRASQTGHLVYTTAHTSSVISAIPRLVDEFPQHEHRAMTIQLLDNLRLIIHQRLVRAAGGGRLALREYLHFTPGLREKIMNDMDCKASLHRLLSEAVAEYGQSLYQNALKRYQEKRIDDAQFSRLQQELCNGK